MTILTALSVVLLGAITVWFVWPLIVDPIARRRPGQSLSEVRRDDLFRSLAKTTGPKGELAGMDRG